MSVPHYLWLLLPTPIQDRFALLIERLGRRYGTPKFAPHITLVGSLHAPRDEVVRRAAALAAALAPVPIRLAGCGWTDQHFRCFFMRAERRPELLAAHATACTKLGKQVENDFMPHLSLIYGTLPQDRKSQIALEIGADFDTSFHSDRIGLCYPDGEPDQWQLIHTFALSGRTKT